MPGRGRHALVRLATLPEVRAAGHGIPFGLARLPHAVPVRQLPGTGHQRTRGPCRIDVAQSFALHDQPEELGGGFFFCEFTFIPEGGDSDGARGPNGL